MEQPVGKRARRWELCPPLPPNPARSLFSYPTTWSFPGSWQDPLSQWEMFFPCHSQTQPTLRKLRGLPTAWLGSLLLPRRLELARRLAARDGLSPAAADSQARPAPQSPHVAPSQHPCMGANAPFFLPSCSHAGPFHFPGAAKLSPFGLHNLCWERDLGEEPSSHTWKVNLVLIYGRFCSYKVDVLTRPAQPGPVNAPS